MTAAGGEGGGSDGKLRPDLGVGVGRRAGDVPRDVVNEVVDAGVDDVGGGGDGPQHADGGMQRGELALAPRVGTQEAGSAGGPKHQKVGSAGTTA